MDIIVLVGYANSSVACCVCNMLLAHIMLHAFFFSAFHKQLILLFAVGMTEFVPPQHIYFASTDMGFSSFIADVAVAVVDKRHIQIQPSNSN